MGPHTGHQSEGASPPTAAAIVPLGWAGVNGALVYPAAGRWGWLLGNGATVATVAMAGARISSRALSGSGLTAMSPHIPVAYSGAGDRPLSLNDRTRSVKMGRRV